MESTPTEGYKPSKYIAPATIKDGFKYCSRLRFEDNRELMGLGLHPMQGLPLSIQLTAEPIKFYNRKREVAGFAGVVDESDGIGRIWMLCTPAVEEFPRTFVREAMRWVNSRPYTMLHNIADPRNKMHLKLLHLLGFKRLSYVPVGPKQLTYVEFAKLCVYP
jgi:hypothetical protein